MKQSAVAALFCLLAAGCSNSQTDNPATIEPKTTNPKSNVSEFVENGIFISKSGRFSIAIPRSPTELRDAGTEMAKSRGIDTGKSFQWKFETTSYRIFYMPPVDPDGNPETQSYYDMESGTRKGILRSDSKLISEKSISIGTYRGTEFKAVLQNGANAIIRIYMIGDTGYQLLGTYIDDKGEKEVLKALDSFTPFSEKP